MDKKTASVASLTLTMRKAGLDPSLLYEAVIELSDEGMLTAGCVNTAAGILLTDLGLPGYFFRHISKDALKRVLRAIAMHMREQDGRYVLLGDLAEVRFDVDGGVQARIATEETRDRMETLLDEVMGGHRVAYYFGEARRYYTYIVLPEHCRELAELKPGESPFAFARNPDDPTMPPETRARYEDFLRRKEAGVTPLVEAAPAPATKETRVMFHDDFTRSALPVIRKVLADLGMTLNRAYWETYRGRTGRVESICSLYLDGAPKRDRLAAALDRLRALLALGSSDLDALFLDGRLEFDEFLFAAVAAGFVHTFIFKDSQTDGEIMAALGTAGQRAAMAKRIFDSNRAEYTRKVLIETVLARPDLVKDLFALFDRRFNPRFKTRPSERNLARRVDDFRRKCEIAFIDDTTGSDVFTFMARLVTQSLKTNFYRAGKRSFAFRLTADVLDPLVFTAKVHGLFYVAGFYATATHMRAEDVARGGLRLIRVTPANYETELDNMPLLNYALGPVAQRLKHKDIAESGAKGVIVPRPAFARDGLSAVFDLTEGVMDLMQGGEDIVDCLGRPEMIFFGPDEGTAPLMDAVALRARERGYRYWRTITTGKSIGIPHDTYGLTEERKVFGLLDRGADGTELQVEGGKPLVTTDLGKLAARLAGRVAASGMTTMGVMACLRATLRRLGLDESKLNLMMTGGPDGDLGANQMQSWKGRISLIVDGGAVLFDPDGLDKGELLKLAVARHANPRLNSLAYPEPRLGPRGFKIARAPGRATLPDGTVIEDGAFFHRNFLATPANRDRIAAADIQVFVPCGGFKDTINARNVRDFLGVFRELRVIIEGANVFFDDAAREVIARETPIVQIKDSSANKGGVTSSSVAEVLTAFLLGDDYEKVTVEDPGARFAFIREIFDLIAGNAVAETEMLLALREKTGAPLYRLSIETSEQLFALQGRLYEKRDALHALPDVVEAVLRAYVPPTLIARLGMAGVRRILGAPELVAYRDAVITKKLAALALYRHAAEWDAFLARLESDFAGTLRSVV